MKRFFATFSSVCLFFMLGASHAIGGSASDPVITQSYLTETFLPSILEESDTLVETRFDALLNGFLDAMEERSSSAAIYAAYLHNAGYTVDAGYGMGGYTGSVSDVYALPLGTVATLTSGSAEILLGSGEMVDITDGTDCNSGDQLLPGHAYISTGEKAAAIRITSQEADIVVTGDFTYIGVNPPEYAGNNSSYRIRYDKYADALKTMGLFLGTDQGYELDRAATRVEGIVMLIRLLGEEEAALSYTGSHPFCDVPSWASRYVAYAYSKGYTQGVSSNEFAPNTEIDSTQYFTFLLRALGYDDGAEDFLWSSAGAKAEEIGLIRATENQSFRILFLRDHVVYTSYRALALPLKGESRTLIEKLIDENIVTVQAYSDAVEYLNLT